MKIQLGCIADDFTGATDLANNLVRAGMRVVQAMGVPTAALDTEADAIVVALKSRTIPKDDAIAQSLAEVALAAKDCRVCGNISTTYFSLAPLFRGLKVVACADINMNAAQLRAEEYGVKAQTIDDLLALDVADA